jgi:hypothetical protein
VTVFPIHLHRWEECRGPLSALQDQDGQLLATIAGLVIVLPLELREKLEVLVGRKTGILRTEKDYRVRCLDV